MRARFSLAAARSAGRAIERGQQAAIDLGQQVAVGAAVRVREQQARDDALEIVERSQVLLEIDRAPTGLGDGLLVAGGAQNAAQDLGRLRRRASPRQQARERERRAGVRVAAERAAIVGQGGVDLARALLDLGDADQRAPVVGRQARRRARVVQRLPVFVAAELDVGDLDVRLAGARREFAARDPRAAGPPRRAGGSGAASGPASGRRPPCASSLASRLPGAPSRSRAMVARSVSIALVIASPRSSASARNSAVSRRSGCSLDLGAQLEDLVLEARAPLAAEDAEDARAGLAPLRRVRGPAFIAITRSHSAIAASGRRCRSRICAISRRWRGSFGSSASA